MLKKKPRRQRRRPHGGLAPTMRWLLRSRLPRLAFLTALGPGLISGFADNDAGGITTYSVVGAQFGYDLMWVVLASLLALAVTQEVGARLGLATGQGFGGLIRQQYGVPRAAFAIGVMLLANLGDTVAEFAGIGAALAIFGVPIWLSSALAALAILFLLSRANFRRIQFIFLAVGIGTSVAYAVSAILAHPDWGAAWRQSDSSSAVAARFSPVLNIGGGVFYFFEVLKKRIPHLTRPEEDPVYANARGYAQAAVRLLAKKNAAGTGTPA